MKTKIKRFLIEKKEILIFIGVLVVVFTAVISIANFAMNSVDNNIDMSSDTPVIVPSESGSDNPVINPTLPSESNDPVINPVTFCMPVALNSEFNIVRTFFDSSLSEDELITAVINTGTYLLESRGISYAKSDNSSFEVFAIYPGTIEAITTDALMGSVITIDHGSNVKSVYSSLATISVTEGETITGGSKIGTSGTSILDNESGVHVHLEIIVEDIYVNPTSAFGKEVFEVSAIK